MAEYAIARSWPDDPEPCRRPRPGPGYWDWRCLICGHQMIRHVSRWQRLRQWVTR